jgi:transcriptional regulator with XRE-family HTH domain
MTPGRIIKLLRTAAGISQGALARKARVTQAYLSQLESDKRTPSIDLARVIAAAMNVPVAFLMVDDSDANREGFDSLRSVLGNLILSRLERPRNARFTRNPKARNSEG